MVETNRVAELVQDGGLIIGSADPATTRKEIAMISADLGQQLEHFVAQLVASRSARLKKRGPISNIPCSVPVIWNVSRRCRACRTATR